MDPVRHLAKRRQIMDAAAELFASKGLAATTTAEICKASAMSAGNVFHYFASKRDIFFAVIVDGEAEKAEYLATARSSRDPLAGLLDVVEILIAPAADPLGPPLVMEAMMQAQRDPDLARWLDRDRANEQAVIEELIRKATVAGQIDPGMDPRHTASWISTLIGAYYLQAATDTQFHAAEQASTLGLVIKRFLCA
ncbi:MAG TPA: TetR/AcrR family transcriptional regulator [Candidatus Limnocylindrales bacterium]